jgi:Tfp pilus assembly protein PilF
LSAALAVPAALDRGFAQMPPAERPSRDAPQEVALRAELRLQLAKLLLEHGDQRRAELELERVLAENPVGEFAEAAKKLLGR